MNLKMNLQLAEKYNNNSQKIRVMTEEWVGNNLFCPYFENNRPVADFFCPQCKEEYELKSKSGLITSKISDGAYETMVKRINSINNPNFFFMQYDKIGLVVKDLLVVPKHFFIEDIIEKRKPLSDNARRAGWIGCNIITKKIPNEGKIYIVKDEKEQPINMVIDKIQRTNFIKEYKINERGWIIDIFNCINRINSRNFTLEQMYSYEEELSIKHPNNNHIKDKIRQQLQLLRDKGVIEFYGKGNYRKVQ